LNKERLGNKHNLVALGRLKKVTKQVKTLKKSVNISKTHVIQQLKETDPTLAKVVSFAKT